MSISEHAGHLGVMHQGQHQELAGVAQAYLFSSQQQQQVGCVQQPTMGRRHQQHPEQLSVLLEQQQRQRHSTSCSGSTSSRSSKPSPFGLATTQLAEHLKPVRLSCPGALGPQDLQQHSEAGSEQSEPWQLSGMLSSSWCDSSSGCFSRQSCSMTSFRSTTSSPLQHDPSHDHHHQHHQAHELGDKQQRAEQQQQHAGLAVHPPPARAASCTPYSPCCSASSDFGDLCCCNIAECSRAASTMSLIHHSAGCRGSGAGRSGSNSSTQSSDTQLSNASTAGDAHADADAARAAAGAARGNDGSDNGDTDHDDDLSAGGDDDDAAAAGDEQLCRSVSVASSSAWSSKSQHVASRPAPGGALGLGIGCVLPQFCGREVLAHYEFGQTLGQGTFGVTRLVTHRKTASMWACKTICKASIAASLPAQSDVQHEVAILQHLRGHSGIVQLRGVYEDERNIHLVMELCTGGDLLDYISRFGRLAEDEAADVASVMLTTLAHCHRLGVVHRDIKPENFLLGAPTLLSAPAGTAARVLKISDFGVSAFHTPGERFTEIVGTPFYMAPEVLERCYGPEADVWSVGVVVFLMLAGRLPFGPDGASDRQIIKAVLDSEPDFEHPAWAGISSAAKDCVSRMLVKDPARRASVKQLLAHPWLAGRTRSSSCCSHAGDGGGGKASSSGDAPACCRSPQHSSSEGHKAGCVSWASPCATEGSSSSSSSLAPLQQGARERRDSSPTPRRPPAVLSPLKHACR